MSKESSARYYAKHKERALKSKDKWRKRGGWAVQKSTFLKRKYGITLEQYKQMSAERNGLCDICGNPPSRGKWKTLAVDHDHVSGKVRGLLCGPCNLRLGFIEHELYQKSLDYLEKTR